MDLWGQFGRREARNRIGLPRLTASAQARIIEKREIRAARVADIVTVTGWKDWEFLSRYSEAHWLPTPLPDESFRTVGRVEDADQVAGFIGNFEYWPNRDAYRMLLDSWLPALRSKGWRIVVAGHHSELLGTPPNGVSLMGSVQEVDDFYRQVNLSLAPIRLGGGMKVKVLESLAKGVPVVGTSEALEGFSPDIRNLCIEWGDSVDLHQLEGVHPIDPASPALDPYRQSSFERTVKEILNGESK
ncbi:glycosyltransferase family 4 protein [Rhodococcus gordoniae]|uniref:glycosyltransferase family 4 protein n=1 Tax=Rhodococcus gordoniae TaxID=223392 RepID=UPI0020CC25E0|nr:glycosyltransferase family 4 protein [Rhodococcus gordoniae]UTT48041.1 glycosyltransferase family 4 protein [Rhodococcus gordoniae]